MPALPDLELYREQLQRRVSGRSLLKIRLTSPFFLRTVEPPQSEIEGRLVQQVGRMGKRLWLGLKGNRFILLHLMLAGRLGWRDRGIANTRATQAAFDFENGTLLFTEAGSKRRAAFYFLRGQESLREYDPGGMEILSASVEDFIAQLQGSRQTLKRALCNPRLFSGIGNAYSDEILHRARLSPLGGQIS